MKRLILVSLIVLLVGVSGVVAQAASLSIVTKGYSPHRRGRAEHAPAAIVLDCKFGEFTSHQVQIDGQTFTVVGLEGASRILERGAPDIPHVCRSVIVPGDAQMKVNVLKSSYYDIENIDLAPSKGSLGRDMNPADVLHTFGTEYDTDGFYPGPLATLGEPYILRNHRGVVVTINPLQYNPVQRVLRVYTEMTVHVVAAGPGRVNILRDRDRKRSAPRAFRSIYKSQFLNYEPPTSRHDPNDANSPYDPNDPNEPNDPNINGGVDSNYAPLNENCEMLIIVHDPWEENIQPLAVWKESIGIDATVVPVDDIDDSDPPSQVVIKQYIQDFYDDENHDLVFVLLVGDGEHVPTFNAVGYRTFWDYTPFYGPADPLYSKLAGTDDYPDILIGRFSAATPADVNTMVERTIDYEAGATRDSTWFWKGTGIGSDVACRGDDLEYDWEHIRNIRTKLLNYGYTTVDELYDGSKGGGDASGDPGTSSVATAVNAGRGLINYCGDGRYWCWATTGFSKSQVSNLTNDNKLPIIFSVACSNGRFKGQTCFAETWLRATHNGEPTGAIAFYGASTLQHWDAPMEAQDRFNHLFSDDVNDDYDTLGALYFDGACSMMVKYPYDGVRTFNTWIVFGDPSLNIMGTVTRKYIYVDADATGNDNGRCWTDAYTDLQDALAAAGDGSEIWVAEGTYKPGTSRGDEFELVSGSALYGGFDGTETSLSQRDWGENPTILSGDIGTVGVDADNCYKVVYSDEDDVDTVIDGFTIIDGEASGDGAGMKADESFATIRNCVFLYNEAADDAGALYVYDDSALTIVNCIFIDNSAADDGGAIFVSASSTIHLINCTVCDNSAGDRGGGIYDYDDSEITNCIFFDNSADTGKDIYSYYGDTIVSNTCTDYCGESGQDWDDTCGTDGGDNFEEGDEYVDDGDPDGDDDKWMTSDDGLRLNSSSDCIDAGDDSAVPSDVTTDIKGDNRIINGDVDIGPYEYDS